MTEAAPAPVGTSDVFAGVMSPAQAQAEIDAIKIDPIRGKLVLTKIDYGQVASPEVAKAKADWARLHALAHPTPQAPSPEDVSKLPAFHDARRQAEQNSQRAMAMLGQGYSAQEVHEIIGGRPIPAAEHEFHDRRIQALRSDEQFMRRWSAGDREARLEMAKHVSGRALRVGTLEQIRAWDAAHPFSGAR